VTAYLSGSGPYSDRLEYPLPCFLLLDVAAQGAFEALTWIRGHRDFRRLPVIVFTQSTDLEQIDRAYALGANSYLVKPFDPEKLRELVKAINAYWVILVEKPSF
jgi:CheY-like chemotaxis protein